MDSDVAIPRSIWGRENDGAPPESEIIFEWEFNHSVMPRSITRLTGEARVNDAFCEMLGYTRDDLGDETTWHGLTHPDDLAETQRQMDELLAGQREESHFEKRFLRKDGTVINAEVHSSLRRDATGSPLYFATTILDITERGRVDEQLRQSAEVYRAMFDSANVGMAQVGMDGTFMDVNQAQCDILGYTREELLGMRIADVTHPDSVAEDVARLDRMFAGEGQSTRIDKRYVRKDGTSVWADLSTVMVHKADGSPDYLVSVIQDITGKKQAETALRASEAELREAQRIARVGSWTWDIKADRFDWSDEMFNLFGLEKTMLPSSLAEVMMDAIHPDDREKAEQARQYLAERRKPITPLEYRVFWADRSVHTLWAEAGDLLLDVDGEPALLMGTVQDVTERKRAEQELSEERELSAAKLARSFASMIQVVSQLIEARDPYTSGHQRRVSELAVLIAKRTGMLESQIEDIRIAALIHDAGKISVPAEILSKPGKLSPIEFELIKGHSNAGYQIVAAAHLEGPTAEIVYQHHERCDGTGYPRGLKGDELLPESKVLMVADVVEAMMSHRPYRPGLGAEAALGEIEAGAGQRYDTDVVAACRGCFREGGFEFSE